MNSNLVKFNDKYLVHPFGLLNNSIICYFNSLIQLLMSCTSINEYLIHNENKFTNSNFMKIYISMVKKYINEDNISNNSSETNNLLLFNEFLQLIKNKNITFGYNQEDAGELLIILLDVLDDKYIYNLFYNKYKCDIYCKKCKKSKEIADDIAIQFELDVDNIPKFTLQSKIDKDLHSMNKYIKNNYSDLEDLECEYCKEKKMIKLNRLLLVPTIILVLFKKFSEKQSYNYPLEIYFINKTENKKHNFKLVSSIHHNGNMSSGHYYTKSLRNYKKQVTSYLLNDIHYEQSNLQPEDNSYILAYHYVESVEYYS